MSQMFQVTGELVDSQHVKLDQPVPLPAGKVRIVVEPLATSGETFLPKCVRSWWMFPTLTMRANRFIRQ